MAIQRVNIPTSGAPVSTADYVAQNAWMAALALAASGRNPVDGSTIHAGTCFMIGGVPYKSVSDTTISGSVTKYCKITKSVDSLTATASFVANLNGVSWNHAYGDYEDVSGNIYFFDEARAIFDGLLTTPYTLRGQMSYSFGDLTVNGDVNAEGEVNAPIVNATDLNSDTLTLSSGIGELSSICGYTTPVEINEEVSSDDIIFLPSINIGQRKDFVVRVSTTSPNVTVNIVLPSGTYDYAISSFGKGPGVDAAAGSGGSVLTRSILGSEVILAHGFYVRRS